MEEDRIGVMYVNLVKRTLGRLWDSAFPRGLARSPLLPLGVLAVLFAGLAIGWQLHTNGQFGKTKRKIRTELHPNGGGSGPGGMPPLVLARPQTPGSTQPQFLSATLLPGVGMGISQITAYLPGVGATPLLVSPQLDEAIDGVSGTDQGSASAGLIEVPWGGKITGGATPLGTTVSLAWNGQTLEIPTDESGHSSIAEGGLLRGQPMDTSAVTVPGEQASATLRGSNFDDRWFSKTDVTVQLQVQAQTIELTVRALNSGEVAEPMGIGWQPRFTLDSAARGRAELKLPNGQQLELSTGLPTGKSKPIDAMLERFQGHASALGADNVEVTLVDLKGNGAGPAVELLEPSAGFGLRLTAESASIRAVRVAAPNGAGYVSAGMQTNMDDPLGHQWSGSGDGIVTLQPGQTLEWKAKLEIFSVPKP